MKQGEPEKKTDAITADARKTLKNNTKAVFEKYAINATLSKGAKLTQDGQPQAQSLAPPQQPYPQQTPLQPQPSPPVTFPMQSTPQQAITPLIKDTINSEWTALLYLINNYKYEGHDGLGGDAFKDALQGLYERNIHIHYRNITDGLQRITYTCSDKGRTRFTQPTNDNILHLVETGYTLKGIIDSTEHILKNIPFDCRELHCETALQEFKNIMSRLNSNARVCYDAFETLLKFNKKPTGAFKSPIPREEFLSRKGTGKPNKYARDDLRDFLLPKEIQDGLEQREPYTTEIKEYLDQNLVSTNFYLAIFKGYNVVGGKDQVFFEKQVMDFYNILCNKSWPNPHKVYKDETATEQALPPARPDDKYTTTSTSDKSPNITIINNFFFNIQQQQLNKFGLGDELKNILINILKRQDTEALKIFLYYFFNNEQLALLLYNLRNPPRSSSNGVIVELPPDDPIKQNHFQAALDFRNRLLLTAPPETTQTQSVAPSAPPQSPNATSQSKPSAPPLPQQSSLGSELPLLFPTKPVGEQNESATLSRLLLQAAVSLARGTKPDDKNDVAKDPPATTPGQAPSAPLALPALPSAPAPAPPSAPLPAPPSADTSQPVQDQQLALALTRSNTSNQSNSDLKLDEIQLLFDDSESPAATVKLTLSKVQDSSKKEVGEQLITAAKDLLAGTSKAVKNGVEALEKGFKAVTGLADSFLKLWKFERLPRPVVDLIKKFKARKAAKKLLLTPKQILREDAESLKLLKEATERFITQAQELQEKGIPVLAKTKEENKRLIASINETIGKLRKDLLAKPKTNANPVESAQPKAEEIEPADVEAALDKLPVFTQEDEELLAVLDELIEVSPDDVQLEGLKNTATDGGWTPIECSRQTGGGGKPDLIRTLVEPLEKELTKIELTDLPKPSEPLYQFYETKEKEYKLKLDIGTDDKEAKQETKSEEKKEDTDANSSRQDTQDTPPPRSAPAPAPYSPPPLFQKRKSDVSTFKVKIITKLMLEIQNMQARNAKLWDSRYKTVIDALELNVSKKLNEYPFVNVVTTGDPNTPKPPPNPFAKDEATAALYRRILKFYKSKVAEVYALHFQFYFKKVRSKLAYIKRWTSMGLYDKIEKYLQDLKTGATPQDVDNRIDSRQLDGKDQAYQGGGGRGARRGIAVYTLSEVFEKLEQLKKEGLDVMQKLETNLETSLSKLPFVDEQEIALDLEEEKEKLYEYMLFQQNKMSLVYNGEMSIGDIMLDSEFMFLYALKVVSWFALWFSLVLAEKLFTQLYMQKVYAEGGNAPNLLIFNGFYVAISLVFMAVLFLVLMLISYIFKNEGNTFVINSHSLQLFVADFFMTWILLGLFGIILGQMIQKRRYFRYQTEGLRGVRALKFAVMFIGIIVYAMPYFIIFY